MYINLSIAQLSDSQTIFYLLLIEKSIDIDTRKCRPGRKKICPLATDKRICRRERLEDLINFSTLDLDVVVFFFRPHSHIAIPQKFHCQFHPDYFRLGEQLQHTHSMLKS